MRKSYCSKKYYFHSLKLHSSWNFFRDDRDPPWMNKKLKMLFITKTHHLSSVSQNKSISQFKAFQSLPNSLTDLINNAKDNFYSCLEVVSATFVLVCFSSLKESTCETWGKKYFTSKALFLSFSRKSKFRILDIQIPWRHQMPKDETRNTFYWITWEINTADITFE